MPVIEELLADYPKTLTVLDIAQVLDLHKDTVWKLLRAVDPQGNAVEDPLPAYRVGGQWIIYRDEFREWMLRRRNTQA